MKKQSEQDEYKIYRVAHIIKATGSEVHYEDLIADNENEAADMLNHPPYIMPVGVQQLSASNYPEPIEK